MLVGVFAYMPSAWPGRPFANGFPLDPRFFAIAVWMQSPSNAAEFKAIGINTFVGLWDGPTAAQLAELSKSGLYVVAEQNGTGLSSPNRGIIKGWMQGDESDNAQPIAPGLGRFSSCIPSDEIARRSRAIKANDPSRPVMLNFGRGVSDTNWIGRGRCKGQTTSYYPLAMAGGDIVSFDIYPVADYAGRLQLVANGVDNLKTWIAMSGTRAIIWNAVEAVPIASGAAPSAFQVRAQVWMSIIHGSQGIIYFVHQFSGDGKRLIREDGIFNFPGLVSAVASINARIAALSPVLNSPTVASGVSVSSPRTTPISTIVKHYNRSTYIFAVAMLNNAGTATFTLPDIQSGTVEVLDEGRGLTVSGGAFHDDFPGYGVHLYKVTAMREHTAR